MLSFPEWLKPVRRHSATSILSSSSTTPQTDKYKDVSYRAYPNFSNDPLTTCHRPVKNLEDFGMIGPNNCIKNISNKPQKSAWGRVSAFD